MRHRIALILLGILSLSLYAGLTAISKKFNWGEGYLDRPIPAYLAVYFFLFIAYAGAVVLALKHLNDRASLLIILAFGLLFRAAIFPSQQIQEDDVYRYLWDGKVFAHGINPYEYAPKQVSDFKAAKIRDPEKFDQTYDERNARELELLYRLKWENPTALVFMERVNHPNVPTIYPPLAQYVFRFVHWVRPDSIPAMRVMFLLLDLSALAFIILTLEALGKNRNLCLIYFWSPLLIKETFNSTHLDIIGISLLCVSLYFYVREHFSAALVFLALSVLGKLYPVVLLPLYIKKMTMRSGNVKTLALNLALFTAIICVFYLPFLSIGIKMFMGLGTFATRWESNDSLFALLLYFFNSVPGLKSIPFLSGNLAIFLCRGTVALILLAALLYLLNEREQGESAMTGLRRVFIMLGLVFILSPVQNPWYLGWIVPLLCFFPRKSWILLSGLAGLYYLDFYFEYQNISQYKVWIPWFEYPLFYFFLTVESGWLKRLNVKTPGNGAGTA